MKPTRPVLPQRPSLNPKQEINLLKAELTAYKKELSLAKAKSSGYTTRRITYAICITVIVCVFLISLTVNN